MPQFELELTIYDGLLAVRRRLLSERRLGWRPVIADFARIYIGPVSARAGAIHVHGLWRES